MRPSTTIVATILLTLSTTPFAQTPPLDPHTLLQQALDRLHEADSAHTKFTYTSRQRAITLDPHGRKEFDTAHTYETTWINDLPYMRLTQVDDKPLTGKDLEREQKLYDEAVSKKKDLGDAKRAKMVGLHIIADDFSLDHVLDPTYTLTEVSHQPLAGDTEHLIEARLLPGAKSPTKCPWRIRFWVSEKDPYIRRFVADTPGDKSAECKDAINDATYTLIDGVPKLNRWTSRFFDHPHSLFERFTDLDDTIYTNYKRFRTTVTLHPTDGAPPPPDPTPEPAPPQP